MVALAVHPTRASGGTYYVATDGSDGNDGTSAATAWATIAYAAARAVAGDTIYVKAGDYGNETVIVGNSGTSNAPIRFEGYRLSPGDIALPGYLDHLL